MASVKDAIAGVAAGVMSAKAAENATFRSDLSSWRAGTGGQALSGIIALLDANPVKSAIADEFQNNTNGSRVIAGNRIIIKYTVPSAQIPAPLRAHLTSLTNGDARRNVNRIADLMEDLNTHYAGGLTFRALTYDVDANTLSLGLSYYSA